MKMLFFLAAFLVAIGILVAVHEFGHYWVAKKLGFKVLRFSIGFGKPLLMRIGKDSQTAPSTALPPYPWAVTSNCWMSARARCTRTNCTVRSRGGPSCIESPCCWRGPP